MKNSYHIQLELFGLPKRTNNNSRTHWRAQMAEAKKWKRLVYDMIVLTKNKPRKPLANAKLICTRFSSQPPDFDGLVSSFKHPIDGLVEAGVIASDKMNVIGVPTYLWEKAPIKKGKIKIEVFEVSA